MSLGDDGGSLMRYIGSRHQTPGALLTTDQDNLITSGILHTLLLFIRNKRHNFMTLNFYKNKIFYGHKMEWNGWLLGVACE